MQIIQRLEQKIMLQKKFLYTEAPSQVLKRLFCGYI